MIEVKNYQLLKVSGNKNFKRISNEIKKIEGIASANIENTKHVLHIEYEVEQPLKEKQWKILEEEILKAIHEYEKKAQMVRIETVEKYRKVLYLNGLDCAHCAMRVETIAKRTLCHEQIIVDFSTGRFIIETYDQKTIENIRSEVTKIAKMVDDRIVVVEQDVAKRRNFENVKKMSLFQKITMIGGMVAFVILWIIDVFWNKNQTMWMYYLYIVPYLLIGYPVVIRFLKNLLRGQVLDETFLMTIASIGAFVTQHPSEAVMVVAFYQIGEILQNKAVNYSRKSIMELLRIEVKTALIKLDNEVTEVDVESLLPGDIVIVNKGDTIPADGKIVTGKTNIDTKNLTGESMLKTVEVGDEVLSGSINMSKMIEVKVAKPYRDSMISRIMDLVENASSTKGKTETFITNFAKYYTPIVVIIAFAIGVVGSLLDHSNANQWIYAAMEFLVISCPCALVISIPLCYFSAIGVASRLGILIKGSNYIEALSQVENVVFDKTGTLTEGAFTVTNVVPMQEDITEEYLLRMLIYTEYYSNHPIGISIVEAYGKENIFPEIISDFQDVTGGSKATVNGNKILIGNDKLMRANKIEIPEIESTHLVIHVVKNKMYIGYVEIGDVIKKEAKKIIDDLHKQHKTCYMLTGDSKQIAEDVANSIEMDIVYSELLPHQKVEIVEEIKQSSKGKTIFVGDGINDAPVIACADVGIAMGEAGSDATIAIADVVIMTDNLEKMTDMIQIATKAKRKVIQNVIFSLTIKFVVMWLTIIFGITSSVTGYVIELPLIVAIFSDVGVSLLAILNALLVMKLKKTKQEDGVEQQYE
ncbi:MAG: cadmium-translocating P-type ATPase [Prevotella sp.]|nr:cadmium-translocating P-type ATPase [Staphylococcus sp.]MCM1350253.1 cadmium-translocating P-type ATPase [Prevotella sp.]